MGGKQFLSAHVYQRLLPLTAFLAATKMKCLVYSLEAVQAYVLGVNSRSPYGEAAFFSALRVPGSFS